MPDSRPSSGRVLALDPGERRIGVAVSNSERSMAFPRPALIMSDHLVSEVGHLVEEEGIVTVVIGLPRHLDGREGTSAASARALAEQLSEGLGALGVAVDLHDERLTTVTAQHTLRQAGKPSRVQREVIDSAAATILLEAWMQCQ